MTPARVIAVEQEGDVSAGEQRHPFGQERARTVRAGHHHVAKLREMLFQDQRVPLAFADQHRPAGTE